MKVPGKHLCLLNLTEPYTGHVHQEVVEELPDMVGGVDLLHFNLCVHIAVIHKVYISSFYLGNKEIRSRPEK